MRENETKRMRMVRKGEVGRAAVLALAAPPLLPWATTYIGKYEE
jgi:hypothetical protein